MELLKLLAFLGCVSFVIIKITSKVLQNRALEVEAHAKTCQQVLEKFGSASEFCNFMETDEGRSLFNFDKAENKRDWPREKIKRHLVYGGISLVLGLFYGIAGIVSNLLFHLSPRSNATTGLVNLHKDQFTIIKISPTDGQFSTLLLAIGLGYLTSAALRYYTHFHLRLNNGR